jgi:YD repeat-containing protein
VETGRATTYDQENRIATATKNGVTTTNTYDDDGNRVEKTSGAGTLYWYMSPGIVAESDLAGNLQSEYVFFDGERVARKDFPGLAVSYYFSDHLRKRGQPELSDFSVQSGGCRGETDACCRNFPATLPSEVWIVVKFSPRTRIEPPTWDFCKTTSAMPASES